MSRKPRCMYCEREGIIAIALKNRGGRNGYLCQWHASRTGDEDYSTRNNKTQGEAKKHGFTMGCEFECSNPTETLRAELINHGFIPTRDCTTDTEFKSPIWQSMNPLPKKFKSIEQLLADGHGEVGHGDGTHFHVGHVEYINAETNDYLARFYHSLFIPLCEEMKANTQATIDLFGRDFTGYACTINEYTSPRAHSNFINLQHSKTIEFRLCKFRTAKQYMNVTKFCVDATKCIINNFIKHFNDDSSTDEKVRAKVAKFESVRAYRKHKADVTANKLVGLYRKYAGLE